MSQTVTATTTPDLPRGQRLLVVEADAVQATLLEIVLQERGYHCTLVERPEQALEMCQQQVYDLALIADSYLERARGLWLSDRLYRTYGLPSLLLTSDPAEVVQRSPYYSGRQEVLHKPYTMHQCLQRVQAVLP